MNIENIIKKYKTPFYLYDIPTLKSRVEMMRGHQKEIGLCYAMKAAPLLAGYIAPFVDRLEVCSPGEYEICIRDNVKPQQILVSGVNKTRESMARILSLGGAGHFTIESPEHFEILEDVTREYNQNNASNEKLNIYIRLTSGNQFGVDRATLESLAEKVISSEYLELVGIHYFSGTQKNLKKIENELTELTTVGQEIQKKFGREFSLEYGPGLGIDYFKTDKNPDKDLDKTSDRLTINEAALSELMEVVDKTGIRNSYSDITFEYGRYIAATCGKYFTGVADVKSNDGTNYAILEGGLHQITYYGSMAGMKVPYIDYYSTSGQEDISPETKINSGSNLTEENTQPRDYVLAGSLCSVNDILVRKISLPKLDIGDTLCFNLTGAYCATEGIALFLSRDLPAVVVVDENGEEKLVREHFETNTFNGGYHG